jgi:UDP-N-acetylglucosamine transferase subunit ALG13
VIFVTVGAQMPFDRLVLAVDLWARGRGRHDVYAQIGDAGATPTHIAWTRFLEPPEFERRVRECHAIVAHAGMGSILTALEHEKPILVMPRRGALRETRNDHQVDTAERLAATGKVHVAMDEHALPHALDDLLAHPTAQRIGPHASHDLITAVRGFITKGNA